MTTIQKVAIFGASGNFGTPITAALQDANFTITIITRPESTAVFPRDLPILRTPYTLSHLTTALHGQDAVICVVGPGGVPAQATMIEAAEAAGVQRFIVNDFGWGPESNSFPEFKAIAAQRRGGWEVARRKAEGNSRFTFTGITTGNPIDWAMKRFPMMGFDVANGSATIYDSGTEQFTGTTLAGIGQAVVGVLLHPQETANRFVKVLSIRTCQNELLEAFQRATGHTWTVQRDTTQRLVASGKRHFQAGVGSWRLELVVAQMFDEGQARCLVAPSWVESDSPLLGVMEERVDDVVAKVLQM
ncbi:aromatic alcohol reductase [Aspergillus saccharolyticus JOP 1030-1]|uniref:NAD(P)-binding protein n=1 Tax=Aspergillus saccharolyticus JOP 1030-1 TaxID=1450539 RepID=A0A318Z8J5_9EURO|nr:NAD(P)-binding protein [Aspergillus saccharolyticus JOP 1030-1]PYH41093.1 NAD(P)-binding protein [Aspergillus saccharolyticus JOP 1030-1]